MLQAVQNGFNFQLHRWSLVRWFAFLFNSQTKRSRRDQRCLFYQPHPTRRLDLKRATGRAFEPLARARWRSNVSAHLTGTPLLPTNHATDPKKETIRGVQVFEFTDYGTMHFQIGLHTFNLTTIGGKTGAVQLLLQKIASVLIAELAPPIKSEKESFNQML
jgi:hypothetical protein